MKTAAREQLHRALGEHLNTIQETFQIFDRAPASSLEKVSWKEVIQMSEQVSKHATTVGMLYAGDTPGVEALEENTAAYFNMLQLQYAPKGSFYFPTGVYWVQDQLSLPAFIHL